MNMPTLTVEYITLACYLLVLLVIGSTFNKFTKNLDDFVRGGAQGTWWLVGSSILMSGISAFTFTGNASAAFSGGPTFLIIYVANCIAYLIGALFLAAWFRQTRAYTGADVVRKRFGVPVEQFFAYVGILLNPVSAAIQLWALGMFASTVLELPLVPTIVTIGFIVIFYSTSGGKWAVMATDFVQGLLMMSITMLVCFLSLHKIGGLEQFFSFFSDPKFADDYKLVKEVGQFEQDRFSLKWIVVIFFMQIWNQISMTTAERYLTVKDGREAKKASLFAFVLMAIGSLVWFIPPMVARFVYGDEILAQSIDNPAESSYAFIARELLPNGLMGIMIAGMFAATMSSMDSGLNGAAGTIMRNIFPRIRKSLGYQHPLADKTELRLCQLFTILLGGLIISFSLLFAGQSELILFDAYLLIGSLIGIPIGVPLVLGLWLPHLPRWSYFLIFGACLIPSAYSIIDQHLYGTEWTIQTRTMWIFIFGFVAAGIALLFRRHGSESSQAKVDDFFRTMHTPVDFEKEIGESRDCEQLCLVGKTSAALGALMLSLLILPNTFWGRMGIVFVAGFILAIGLLLLVVARRVKRRSQSSK